MMGSVFKFIIQFMQRSFTEMARMFTQLLTKSNDGKGTRATLNSKRLNGSTSRKNSLIFQEIYAINFPLPVFCWDSDAPFGPDWFFFQLSDLLDGRGKKTEDTRYLLSSFVADYC